MNGKTNEYFESFKKSTKLWVGTLLVSVLLIVGVFSPLISPHDPYKISVNNRLAKPSKTYLLGTDHLGRDTLSQIIYGTRTSILISVTGTIIAFGIGLLLGIVAAYVGGIVENVILLYFDAIRSFPAIILILVVVSIVGPSVLNIIIIFGFTYSSLLGRTIRAVTLSVIEEPFIEAAKTLGSKTNTILFRHILQNVLGPTLIVAGMYIPIMIMSEAGLSFLGLGVPPPTPSWGATLRYGFENIMRAWWLILSPSVALALSMLSFNLFAEGLRDIMNPEKRGELLISGSD
jgi:peptide/nickel transport system permease protein/oligopeptide transport system permease protein